MKDCIEIYFSHLCSFYWYFKYSRKLNKISLIHTLTYLITILNKKKLELWLFSTVSSIFYRCIKLSVISITCITCIDNHNYISLFRLIERKFKLLFNNNYLISNHYLINISKQQNFYILIVSKIDFSKGIKYIF